MQLEEWQVALPSAKKKYLNYPTFLRSDFAFPYQWKRDRAAGFSSLWGRIKLWGKPKNLSGTRLKEARFADWMGVWLAMPELYAFLDTVATNYTEESVLDVISVPALLYIKQVS